jgi:hypothetical protein
MSKDDLVKATLHFVRCHFVLVETAVVATAQQPAHTPMLTTSSAVEQKFVPGQQGRSEASWPIG